MDPVDTPRPLRPERPSDRVEGVRLAQRPHERVPVDINRASARTLSDVDGIGHVRARQIVAYRDRHGPYGTVDELACLPLFDRELVEKLRPRLKA